MWPEKYEKYGGHGKYYEDLRYAMLASPTIKKDDPAYDPAFKELFKVAKDESKDERPYLIGANPKDDGKGTITGQPIYLPGNRQPVLDHDMHREEHTVTAAEVRALQDRMDRLARDMVTLDRSEKRRQEAWTKLSDTLEREILDVKEYVKNLNVEINDAQTITRKLDDCIIQIADIYEILEEID